MHIKGTYSLHELQKPFVVAYLVPNLNNELVKQEAVRHFFTSAQELYGGHNTEGSRKAIFVEDDVEEGMEYERSRRTVRTGKFRWSRHARHRNASRERRRHHRTMTRIFVASVAQRSATEW